MKNAKLKAKILKEVGKVVGAAAVAIALGVLETVRTEHRKKTKADIGRAVKEIVVAVKK